MTDQGAHTLDTHRYTTPQALDPSDPGQANSHEVPTVFHVPQQNPQGNRRRGDMTDPLLERLKANYQQRDPAPLSDSIAMEPTGFSRRLGQ